MGKQVAARLYGGVAQLGEHLPCKQGVKSSNLSISICTKAMSHAAWRTNVYLYLENFIQKEILNKINILIKTSENNKPK